MKKIIVSVTCKIISSLTKAYLKMQKERSQCAYIFKGFIGKIFLTLMKLKTYKSKELKKIPLRLTHRKQH